MEAGSLMSLWETCSAVTGLDGASSNSLWATLHYLGMSGLQILSTSGLFVSEIAQTGTLWDTQPPNVWKMSLAAKAESTAAYK